MATSCKSLRGSATMRVALLALLFFAVLTALLDGASSRALPGSAIVGRPVVLSTIQRITRTLQEDKKEGGNSEGGVERDSAASEESEAAAEEKRPAEVKTSRPGEGDGEEAERKDEDDSEKSPVEDAEVKSSSGTEVNDPEQPTAERKRTKKSQDISETEQSDTSPQEMEIVGRGDEETPKEIPPELSDPPLDEEKVEKVLANKVGGDEEVSETESPEDGGKGRKRSRADDDQENQPLESSKERADASDERTEEGAADSTPVKRKKRGENDAGHEDIEASRSDENGEQGELEEMPARGRKRKGDGAKKENDADDQQPDRANAEDDSGPDVGKQADEEENETSQGDDTELKRSKKHPNLEEQEENQEEELQQPEGLKKGSRKGIPQTVEAREREDSGNSGVADEMALGDGGAAKVELENFGGDVPDSPVASVGAPEALALEEAALDDEEDYASFMSELFNAGQRITPAMQGLKEKTEKHVVPTVQELARSSHAAFMKTSDKIRDHVTPILGPSLSPVVATLLSISLLLIPLVLISVLVYQIRFILTLQRLLVLCNLYLFLYCFVLLVTCIIMSGEPMRSLLRAAEANFFVLQFFVVVGYLTYLGLQFWWLASVARAKGNNKDPIVIAKAVLQCTVAVGIALHYYIFVFERAVLDKPPRITAWGYLVYSLLFLLLTLIGRPKDSQVDVGKHT